MGFNNTCRFRDTLHRPRDSRPTEEMFSYHRTRVNLIVCETFTTLTDIKYSDNVATSVVMFRAKPPTVPLWSSVRPDWYLKPSLPALECLYGCNICLGY